jgi:hypothetical protein
MKSKLYYLLASVPHKSKLWFFMRNADKSILIHVAKLKGNYCKKNKNDEKHIYFYAFDEYVYASNTMESLLEKYADKGIMCEIVNSDEIMLRIAEQKLSA